MATSRSPEHDVELDRLTALGTRRSLLDALAQAVEPESPATSLVLFGLEGFDEHAGLFGRLAARTLVVRLAARLSASLGPAGSCYRPRRDEFAALLSTTIDDARPVLDATVRAMGEGTTALAVRASWAAVSLPMEAADPIDALELADERLKATLPRPTRRDRRACGSSSQSSTT